MEDEYLKKVKTHYPNAERSDELGRALIRFLCEKYKLPPDDILAANSICSDDLNSMQFPHISKDFLGPFNMGGLDGFPFTGLTGMKAFAHHVPKDGALLIFYAPHIGIPQEGLPGTVFRIRQPHASSCCGAATGALPKADVTVAEADCNSLDYQMDYIKQIFNRPNNKARILAHKEIWQQMIEATEVMYEAIHERIEKLVTAAIRSGDVHCKYLFLIGGIFINGDAGKGSFGAYRHHKVIEHPGAKSLHKTDLLKDFEEYYQKKLQAKAAAQ